MGNDCNKRANQPSKQTYIYMCVIHGFPADCFDCDHCFVAVGVIVNIWELHLVLQL